MLTRKKALHNKIYNYREMSLFFFVLLGLFVLSLLYRNIWKRINRKKTCERGKAEKLGDIAKREKKVFPRMSFPSLQYIKLAYNLSPCL